MMIKFIIIFIFGIIETYLFAGWNLSVNKKQAYLSSLLMFIYMTMYLIILDVAFKDAHSTILIIAYSTGCTLGNFIRINQEKRKNG